MADVTVVMFTRTLPPYLVGEEAGLPSEIAKRYVDAGAAQIVRVKAPLVDPATLAAQRKAEDEQAARSARASQSDDAGRRQAASNRGV
jgi:hypothetical protein